MSAKCYIIAEAGVNHNGSPEIARKLIDAAAEAGADAVKFQTFRASSLATCDAPKAEYQKTGAESESQLEMLSRLELAPEEYRRLFDYASERSIEFLSTAFDLESLAFLDRLGIRRVKVPSGEITNYPMLEAVGKLGKPVILSTGMAEMKEIEAALNVLNACGTFPEEITVLHCTTRYPTPPEDVNLRAMLAIASRFAPCRVGYSDHTLGIEVPVAAVTLGAEIIEKHLTLDRNMDGPDHAASAEPDEFGRMVRAVRNVETALGGGKKIPTPGELANRVVARKSIVAARDIREGETFSAENLTVKRPGDGMSPMEWPELLGSLARRSYRKDEPID